MTPEDIRFQRFLEGKYTESEVKRAGKHNPGVCDFELFILVADCGCIWHECSCGYTEDLICCTEYQEVLEYVQ